MDFNDLTPEQKERVRACKTSEEIAALAEEEGYDLSDEQLDAIAGGSGWGVCGWNDNDSESCTENYLELQRGGVCQAWVG